jgi:Holliday junction DNA helicase RuvA
MIVSVRGQLVRWDADSSTVWIDVQGVSYEVLIPAFAADWIETLETNGELHLYTYYHASERNPTPQLIGFRHQAEREFFRKFIEVPDIGPVKAVRALTHPVAEIARWIEAEDASALTQLPGIGQRGAQTIVATLAGRLVQEALLQDRASGEAAPEPATPEPGLREDAVEALISLQYARRTAERLVSEALSARPDVDSLETLLRTILEQQAPA